MNPLVHRFFDEKSSSCSYIVVDKLSSACAVLDAAKGFDHASSQTDLVCVNNIITFIEKNHYRVEWILQTQIHIDQFSAATYVKQRLGGKIGISKNTADIQSTFRKIFRSKAKQEKCQFDHLFKDNDLFKIGNLNGRITQIPGYPPACKVIYIGNAIFAGDTRFMPTYDEMLVHQLHNETNLILSLNKALDLSDNARLFPSRNYPSNSFHSNDQFLVTG